MSWTSRIIVLSLLGAVYYAFYCGYLVRSKFRELQRHGIPMMKHSVIFGHLEVIGKLMSKVPSDAHGDYMMVMILENWRELFPDCTKCPPVVYIDLWPFAPPMMISMNQDVSVQFMQTQSVPKAYQQKSVLWPLTHNRDIASMEGAEWKIWRKRLNAAFSIRNISSKMPGILEEIEEFVSYIETRAGQNGQWGDVFRLQDLTVNLTLDVILRFIFNKRFRQQSSVRPIISTALFDSISWSRFYVNFANFILVINPWRQLKLWNDYRILKNEFTPHLNECVESIKRQESDTNKTLIDLIIQSVEEEKEELGIDAPPFDIQENFLEEAVGQINTFLFAGYDTTATTICWLFHSLSSYPEILAKVRAEHDNVLGKHASQAAQQLRENPNLLNLLPYSQAVIKESMRVNANVGSMRRGEPGSFVTGPPDADSAFAEKQLPTDGFVIWDGVLANHRDPEVWHRVDDFIPERYLITEENDPLYPPKNAWRSFSMGPRVCIGQHLALLEIKIVMVLLARRFDIECAWSKWDAATGNKAASKPEVWGDRCYQVAGGDSPPRVKDGMPVHVRIRA